MIQSMLSYMGLTIRVYILARVKFVLAWRFAFTWLIFKKKALKTYYGLGSLFAVISAAGYHTC